MSGLPFSGARCGAYPDPQPRCPEKVDWQYDGKQLTEECNMYEYKVLILGVNECEDKFNQLAKDGWRLVAMVPNQAIGFVATLERKAG